ncbi:cation:proton antiporter [Actinomyces bouchesdurhonensis]|uniref:cation:proton antiporter n=1 Tax=Actinomyces bouchesdurhonensis TaxID=1852361 RepID=UPI003AF07013
MTVEAIIVLGIAAVCCILLTNRFNLIGPVLLIAAGAGASFIPGVSEASLSPTIVLTIFLPFLLYWESLSVSLVRMKRALRGIILSATVLVIITAGIIAGVGVALGLSLGAALLIGACLGPTDATAVASLGKGIAPAGRTILQSESLLNDGTALAIFAIALSIADNGQSVTTSNVITQFVLSIGAGAGAGLLCGLTFTTLLPRIIRIDNDPLLAVLCTIVSPFVAYFAAEELHGSGVLAVVTAGVFASWRGVGADTVRLRAFGRPFWTVTTFLLNTILFLMVGVSLPGIISSMPQATLTRALILIPAIYVGMVLARFVGHHSIIFAIRALDRRPQQRERRTNFRSRLVTTVAGFRGAISLAMAVSIPLAFGNSVYEERDIIILVVAGVTLLSLIIQGIALPVVVRWAAQAPTPFLEMDARAEAGETQAVGATVRDLIEEIDSLASSVDVTDADTIERVRADYLQRMHNLMMSGNFKEYRAYAPDELRLRLACVSFLRNAAFEQRRAGNIDDSTFDYIRDCLDTETRHIEGPLEVE